MESDRKFKFGESRYDLNTFFGRYYHNIEIVDPRTLFVTDKELKKSIKILEDYKSGTSPSKIDDTQLWEAQKIKKSIIHPDTGEKIFIPFRMSGYVPFNSLILAGMLLKSSTIPQLIFWQWLNQSHNACVNYANRNGTRPSQVEQFKKSYVYAVTTAVTIATGINLAIKKVNFLSQSIKLVLLRFAPLPAVMTASTLNVVFMRKYELEHGIDVTDKSGNVIGSSKFAAKSALKEMAISRAVLPLMNFTMASTAISYMENTKMIKVNPRLSIPTKLFICSVTFFINLTTSLSIFPQKSEIKVENLEEGLQTKTNEKYLFYNKGL